MPLNPLPNGINQRQWGNFSGFGADPAALLPVTQDDYTRATIFDGRSFLRDDGQALDQFDSLLYNKEENESFVGKRLPNFARLNLDVIPLACLQDNVLIQFANARGVDVGGADRDQIEAEVQKKLDDKVGILPPNEVAIQIDRWVVSEVLEMADDNDWETDSYYDAVNNLKLIDESDVDRFYPIGNEHNRERAFLLCKAGGPMVRSSMAVRKCRDARNGTEKLLIRCDII